MFILALLLLTFASAAHAACNGDPNAVQDNCLNLCRPICAFPEMLACPNCFYRGCKCRDGYILDNFFGKCIKKSDCPQNLGCKGDPNAIKTDCGSLCPPTCEPYPEEPIACPAVCVPDSCVCKPGYILSEARGRCIPKSQCLF